MGKTTVNMNIAITKVGASGNVAASASDKDFLEKVISTVLDNITDGSFTMDRLRAEMKISRSHLYRKLKFLTGQNPSGFIRTVRLKYAARLLEQHNYLVKEIALLSGFSSHVYFAKTFRELYGITPQQYQKKNRKSIPIEVLQSDIENLIVRKEDNNLQI